MRPRACLRPPTSAVANERGAVLALIALLLIAFLGLAALAIDLGLLYTARGEAQRAADAAAHAGAVHWMHNMNATEEDIQDASIRLGLINPVRGEAVDITRADVEVLWDEYKVRARVHRTAERANPVRTLFAQVLGFGRVGVGASAAAEIWPAEGAECILPLAVSDRWCENGDAANCSRYSDAWMPDNFDPELDGDVYVPWIQNPTADPDDWTFNSEYTGYNSRKASEGGSVGDSIMIKVRRGNEDNVVPGNFGAVVLPGCDPGANCWRDAISECTADVDVEWRIGDDVTVEPGAMTGPTRQGFDALIAKDPDAYWNHAQQCVYRRSPSGSDDACVDSPRIRPVPVFEPYDWPDPGRKDIRIVNLVAGFVESVTSQAEVRMRFVQHVGLSPMSTNNPDLVEQSFQKIIRIVE